MGIDAGIGAEGHFCAGLKCMAEILTLETSNLLFLFNGLGQHSSLRAFLENVVVIVDIKDKISSVLLGEGDAFVIDQAGVLDGIDAGANGVFDGLCAVSVGGNFAAKLVGFLGDSLHLFESELGSPGLIAFAENATGGADFDYIGAIFDDFANFGARGPGAVGDSIGFVSKFRRKQVVVAVASGDAERRTGDAQI